MRKMSRSFLMDSIINDSSKTSEESKQCSDIEDEHIDDETSRKDHRDRLPSHLFPYPYLFSLHAQNHLLYKNKLNDFYQRDHLFSKNINSGNLFYDPSRFYLNSFVSKSNLVRPVPVQSAMGLHMNQQRRYGGYRNNNEYKFDGGSSSATNLGKLVYYYLLGSRFTINQVIAIN